MAVQGVTRLQAKIRSKQQREDIIAGARDDFLAICRRLDEGAPPEIAARPRWPGPGLCAPTFAPLVPPQHIAWSPPPSPDRPLAAPRSPARPPRLPTPPASPARMMPTPPASPARPPRLPTPPASPARPPHYVSSPESPASSLEPPRRAPPPLPPLSPQSPSEQLEAAVSEDELRRELAWATAALRSRLDYLEARGS